MPATLIKNKNVSGPNHAFYINTNSNHVRLFLKSADDVKFLGAKLEENKIVHSIESGGSFFEAYAKAAATPERKAEIEREDKDLAECQVIKIGGLHNLYNVLRLLPHDKVSTHEFYNLLLIAVQHKADPMADRQKTFEKLRSGQHDSVTPDELKKAFSISSENHAFKDFHGFLTAGMESEEITSQQIHDLSIKNPNFQRLMNLETKLSTDGSVRQRELHAKAAELTAQLQDILKFGISRFDKLAPAPEGMFRKGPR